MQERLYFESWHSGLDGKKRAGLCLAVTATADWDVSLLLEIEHLFLVRRRSEKSDLKQNLELRER